MKDSPRQSPSKVNSRLEAIAQEISKRRPSGDELVFSHAAFCQLGLPRSKVSDSEFFRESGRAWLRVDAGYFDEGSGPVLQEIPYGAMPRLALTWVSTYAVRHKTNRILIGNTATDFLKLLDLDTQGSRYDKLHQAIKSLAACRIQFGLDERNVDGTLISHDAWKPLSDNGRRRWPGVLILDDQFYRSLRESAIPLDRRAMWALKGSSLALDVYTWLAQRLYRVPSSGSKIRWKAIRNQFASEYSGKNASKDFKNEFRLALQKVLKVYPWAKARIIFGGLQLETSEPPVQFKPMPIQISKPENESLAHSCG